MNPAVSGDKDLVASLPRWKRALFATVIVLLPLIVLCIFELGARTYFWIRYGVPGKRYGIWRPDPELGATPKENGYNSMAETNNWGFRNREDVLDPKPPDSLRLVAYGGSTTYCYQLHNDEAWPARLEQILRSRRRGGERDQVLNGGAVMWSIGEIYVRARRELPVLKPDYVLIYSGVNEPANAMLLARDGVPMEDLIKQGRYGVYSTDLDQASWIKREMITFKLYQKFLAPHVLDLLAWVTAGHRAPPSSGPDPAVLENYRHVLGDLIKLAKENGARPVFIVEITWDPTPENLTLTSYSRAGADLAAGLGAIVIDPSPILEGNPEGAKSLFVTQVHYSEPGARKLAAFLYERLIEEMPFSVH